MVTATTDASAAEPPLRAGERVGRVRVVEPIGHGGMGVVYLGLDEALGRNVALKVVGRGGSDEGLLAEARALASLSHPNVVEIYEVLEHAGKVVLVMAYVRGPTLRQWTRQRPRAWHEVVPMVAAAGAALAAAHRSGLLHRDVKPSNIVIGDDGRPRLVDFGLSCALGDPTVGAGVGRSVIVDSIPTWTTPIVGTPAYMAPEQLLGAEPTAAGDQYALCVTLYEALHGVRPWSELELDRLLAAKLAGPPRRATSSIPGWLHRAIARGLSPDPERRFDSVDALLDRLSLARHRSRARLGWTAAIGVAACVAAVVPWTANASPELCRDARRAMSTTWSASGREALRVALAEQGTDDSASRIDARLDAFARDWDILSGQVCDTRSAGAPVEVATRAQCLVAAQRQFGHAVAALATSGAAEHAWRVVGALEDPRGCGDATAMVRRGVAIGDEAADVLDRVRALARAGSYDDAQRLLDNDRVTLVASEDLALRADTELTQGQLATYRAEYLDAERHLQDAYFLGRRAHDAAVTADAAIALVDVVGVQQARHDDGLRWARHAEAELADDDRSRHARLDALRANIAAARGDFATAISLHERSIEGLRSLRGEDESELGVALNDLAIAHAQAGDLAKARGLLEESIAIYERTSGPDHPEILDALVNLGAVLQATDEFVEARALFERALRVGERTWGPRHPRLVRHHNNLGVLHARDGDDETAATHFEAALALAELRGDPNHPELAATRTNLALVLSSLGRHDEALVHAEAALGAFMRSLGADHMRVAEALLGVASVHAAAGDPIRALGRRTEALEAAVRAVGSANPRVQHFALLVAEAQLAAGLRAEAHETATGVVAASTAANGPSGDLERAREIQDETAPQPP